MISLTAPFSPVVSTTWLYDQLSNPEVVILDCRFNLMQPDLGEHSYHVAHIPGAVYLHLDRHLSSPVQSHGGRHPLPEVQTFAELLGTLGIAETTPVVAYDDSRQAFAARAWWLLRHWGHDRVAVLDGGFGAWQRSGYPVTSEIPVRTPTTFVPRLRTNDLCGIDQVQGRSHQSYLIDSRERDRYLGNHEPIDPIAGHIPGALNFPWQEATTAEGMLLPPEQQQQRWQAIDPRDAVIVYCGSGVTACVNLLSLELAGVTTAKLYAGSWSDWCSYQRPIDGQ